MALELYQSNFENALSMLQTPTVNISVLTSAPQAAIFLHGLVLLASVVKDTSLENNYTMNKIQLLKTPRSFKASLYQVAASMSGSFRVADQSMFKIKINLDDVPNTLTSMVDAYTKPKDKGSRFMIDLNLRSLGDIARTCSEEAEKVRSRFDDTLELLEEMGQVTIATQGFKTHLLENATKDAEEYEQRKKNAEEDRKITEQAIAELKQKADKAEEDYRKSVKDMKSFWKQLGASFNDALSSMKSIAGGLFGMNGREDGVQCIGAGFQSAMKQSGEETGGGAAPPPQSCFKPSARGALAHAAEMNKEVLLHTRGLQLEYSKMEAAQRKILAEIGVALSRLNTEKVELSEIIKYLQQAIQLLGDVTKQWRILQDFFVTMETMIKNPLAKSLKRFDEIVQSGYHEDSPLVRGAMIMEGFKVVATALSVGRTAGIYSQTSKKFVTPLIDDAAGKLALTREQGQTALSQMYERNEKLAEESNDFIEEKIKESAKVAYQQLVQFHDKFKAAMPQITVDN